jgi:hypothetical protein
MITDELETTFERIHRESVELLAREEFQKFKSARKPFGKSPCELIVRSAAKVEQCFGGITANLWDDPFEWTLPECMKSQSSVSEYLDEATAARKRGFRCIGSDDDLTKQIAAPGKMKTLFSVILKASMDADNFLSLARAAMALPKSDSTGAGYKPDFS